MAKLSFEESELIERLEWLIRLRWIAAGGVIFVVAIATLILRVPLASGALYSVAVAIALCNGIYTYFSRQLRQEGEAVSVQKATVLVNAQISVDLFLLILLIHFSGGIENPFAFYFIFHVAIASILLPVTAAYLQATLAVLLFGGMVFLEYRDIISHVPLIRSIPLELHHDPLFVWAGFLAFISTLYISAFMVTSISRRLRHREQEILTLSSQLEERADQLQTALDKLRETEEVKTLFLRKVSHELRSPLASIQSVLKVVLEGLTGDVSPKALEMIDRAERRIRILLKLINDLLILSRMRVARLPVQMEPTSICEIAGRVVELLTERARSKDVDIKLNLQASLPPIVADPASIEQLFTNLIANAIKYTPEHGRVTLKCADSADHIQIQVSDTGIGIPADELPRIFEEFYRAHNARAFAEEGTGLGLSIVKSIVETHKGTITVHSEVGKGTTFSIILPKLPSGG